MYPACGRRSLRRCAIGKQTTGIKKSISTWAKSCGAEKTECAQFGGDNGTGFGFGCANTIVLSKIKAILGLTSAKVASLQLLPSLLRSSDTSAA